MAAACCGSGFTVPSIITTDDKAQATFSYQYAKAYADVFTNGNWQKRRTDDITQTWKLEAAHIFKDRWQGGISLPYQQRKREMSGEVQSQGLADISLQMGYEYWTDWTYHAYRPKGIGYLSFQLPTGRSIYESEDGSGVDARGRGFWGIGVGSILTKNWNPWDVSLNLEIHHSFSKHVHNRNVDAKIKPGQGAGLTLGGGYSWQYWRLGGLIAWVYEDAIGADGTISTQGNLQRVATGSLVVSYLFNNNSTAALSYNDQTIFGSPYNTTLNKSILLFYQMRWER